MKAVRVHQFGDPSVLKLEDVADPVAGAGEVLVRVRASGVNPVDTYVRAGTYPALPPLPYITGTELAGEIVAGPRKGERIFAAGTTGPRNTGCHAELAVVADAMAHRLPDHLSFAEGAAIPVAFGTAYRALVDRGLLLPGQTVLIHGASGGVGNAATQIASTLGATVIGTASTDEGRQAAINAGAKYVFNHKDANYREQIKQATLGGKGVDLIIEMLANVNLDHDLDLLIPGGRVVVVGSRGKVEIDPRKTMGQEKTIAGMTLWGGGEAGLRRTYTAIGALLARKAIKPIVGVELTLADAAKAHELVLRSGREVGKIVLLS